MKKFEYMSKNGELYISDLNELGKEGWELCQRIEYKSESITEQYHTIAIGKEWIFKREILD